MKKLSWLFRAAQAGCLLAALSGDGVVAASTNQAARVYRDKVDPHWFADASGTTNRFWYRVGLASNQCEFVLVDAGKGERKPAFDHARIAAALTKETGESVAAGQLPISALDFSPDGQTVEL